MIGLAAARFDIEHVTNVFYVDRWLTVTQDGEADWPGLVRNVAAPICAAPTADAQTVGKVAAATNSIAGLSREDQQRLGAFNVLLDEQIRPALQADGGDVHVVGLDGNQLSVH